MRSTGISTDATMTNAMNTTTASPAMIPATPTPTYAALLMSADVGRGEDGFVGGITSAMGRGDADAGGAVGSGVGRSVAGGIEPVSGGVTTGVGWGVGGGL